MKTTRRLEGQSKTVMGLLYVTMTLTALAIVGCGNTDKPEGLGNTNDCLGCGGVSPTGGSGGVGNMTTHVGSAGGIGGAGGYVGGIGGEGNIGNTGGTGGAGAIGGTTTAEGGSGGGDIGGYGGSTTTTESGGTGGTTTTTTTPEGGGGTGGTTTTTTTTETGGGGTGGDSGTGGSGSGGVGGTGGTELHSFSCSSWARNASFDAFKIGGYDVQLVGGMWGTSGSNIYVTAGTYTSPVVAHWNGSSWVSEALPGSPLTAFGIWGTSDDDVWATARTSSVGMLYHRSGGIWTDDTNKPYAKSFVDIWGSDSNNVWLIGWQSAGYRVWRKNGALWVEQALPAISTPSSYTFTRVWGISNNVFVTGYTVNSGGNSVDGFLLRFDGSNWSLVGNLPTDTKELSAIYGVSVNDLFVTGMNDVGQGTVYHVTDNLATWDEYADNSVDLYGPAWSKSSGTVLTAGTQPPAQAGALRMTLLDEVDAPQTDQVDTFAYGAVRFWPEPGTDTVHFVHISAPGTVAGHYTGSCN